MEKRGMNHFGDTHAGALAFGAIRGNFDGILTVVSADIIGKVARHKKRRVKYVYK